MKNKMTIIQLVIILLFFAVISWGDDMPKALKAVGVLGNTSGLSDRPVPYSFYTGIAIDKYGRLYLAGANEGITVCDQKGKCLAVIELPNSEGMISQSLMVRSGESIFFVAVNSRQEKSALYRINTASEDLADISIEMIANGIGIWAVSPTLDKQKRVIVGQSVNSNLTYPVVAYDSVSGTATPLFTLQQPQGAKHPWLQTIQVEPDNSISIKHLGGNNWSGLYLQSGKKVGEAIDGQIYGDYRYFFGYNGGLTRTDLTGTKPSPGNCGAALQEIRMAAQMAQSDKRYFFAGRSGVVEAKWNGSNFIYTRRIGAISLNELIMNGNELNGIAFTSGGNNDVQHVIRFAKEQQIGELLDVDGPLHGKNVISMVPGVEGNIIVYRNNKGFAVGYSGAAKHCNFELNMPYVKSVEQAAVIDNDLVFADPIAGTLWRRPLMDKTAPAAAWKTNIVGVTGLAITQNAIFIATSKRVSCLSLDGLVIEWKTPEDYKGIRRLAATADYVYVCDTAGNIVDQLDAKTGEQVARLGVMGEAGCTLDHLNKPYAIAADLNGVYIADNGNGRIVIATTTLWKPDICFMPREDNSPIVAVNIPVKPPMSGRMSLNIYNLKDQQCVSL